MTQVSEGSAPAGCVPPPPRTPAGPPPRRPVPPPRSRRRTAVVAAGVLALLVAAGAGDVAGLYQQDPDRPACDGDALVSRLQADPPRAGAWARVQRTSPAGLTAFVTGLTPVVLRADTAVVDHGYRDGASVPTPVVLAAGTAVFVDRRGLPAAKCWSGNPLTPGWSGDRTVTTVQPAAMPITTLTVLDPVVERLVDRPVPGGPTGHGRVGR